MTWIYEPGWSRAIVRVFLHIAVFVAVAPIIEGLICALLAGIWALVRGITFDYPAFFLTFYWFTIFGYILGLSAAFTGLFVAIASTRIVRSRWLFIFASVISSLSSVANFVIVVGSGEFSSDLTGLAEFIVGAATAAAICTALTKRFRRNGKDISIQTEPHLDMRA